MLELKGIKKVYPVGDGQVDALKGIDIQFRESEFVSILGPSGCGKTTMLNIVGGLDQYTDGDLVINGKSTKDFKDRDWDSYRNHSVGFVFQSYNLIPHQTVLQNVELALTLSGVSKSERRKRAKEALEKVGLSSQLNKKPSEMSGGQMQRVAIARAIVNNPNIILADEPTGALDTETSVQVMEILKEISKDRLIVMVTHNPDLAEKYSTRIIRMLDGEITDDTSPLTEEEINNEVIKDKEKTEKEKKVKKPSMSFATSFGLSLKNLFTKKGRTFLTTFAGSIGIIGIALIFAVSQGMTTYINTVQEETLSSYPLTLEAETVSLASLLEVFMGTAKSEGQHENDAVYQKGMIYNLINALNNMETKKNDLASFKKYIEERLEKEPELKDVITGIQYTYNMDLLVYTENVDGAIIRSDAQELMMQMLIEYFGMDMSAMFEMQENSSMGGSMMGSGNMMLWQELLTGDNGKLVNPLLDKQYDVIYGTWPTQYDEIVIVVDDENEIDDLTLYALGLKSKEDIDALMDAAINKTELNVNIQKWTYEEICDMEFKVVLGADCYRLDETTGLYVDLRDSQAGLKYLYDNGLTLKVSGIIRPKEDAVSTMLTGSIGYTKKLTEYVVERGHDTDAVKEQLANPTIDIFTGLPFADSASSLSVTAKKEKFLEHLNSLNDAAKAQMYIQMMSIPTDEELQAMVNAQINGMETSEMVELMIQAVSQQITMSEEELRSYIESMSEEELRAIFAQMMGGQMKIQYAEKVKQQMSILSEEELLAALNMSMQKFTDEQYAKFYEEILLFSEATYEENMRELGYVHLENPDTINLYASSFENKDIIEDIIADYNKDVDEVSQIAYTDYVGLMMSSVTTIINAITYVLIAFVAVSLIVSSIMIGVITLISVQERTKEIGILRSIGASKRNVSSMFNAETVIIGFSSGLFGVVVTYLLCIPINLIMHEVTGLNNLNAILPLPVAVILIVISMILTLFAGIIPSRSAAKKDPVVALRTE